VLGSPVDLVPASSLKDAVGEHAEADLIAL
jgi:hypothetical protein